PSSTGYGAQCEKIPGLRRGAPPSGLHIQIATHCKDETTMTGFAHSARFTKDVPAPAPRWTGFPQFNFIGGHNDPTPIPASELAETAAAVLRRSGARLAMYNSDGPQGYRGLRDFVLDKVSGRAAITCSADDVLITSGSGQGLDLVYRLLLEPGD